METGRSQLREAGPGSEFLHEFLLAGVAAAPDLPAVVDFFEGTVRETSHLGLERQAQFYASRLSDLGLGIGDRVVVESENSGAAIALLIACASLGVPFIPVSPGVPRQRLQAIVAAAEPVLHLRAVGTDERPDIPVSVGLATFGPDHLLAERAPVVTASHRTELVCTDPAYIIFTSGTTGVPKGVVMSHRAIISFYRGMLAHDIVRPGDRVASTSPLQFDFSLLDTGLALGSGAAVVPVPRELLPWPRKFLAFLDQVAATHVNGAPSIWRNVLTYEPERLARLSLRGVLFSGEEFPLAELRALQKAQPGARIVNCFGSTESVACSFADVPRPLPDGTDRLSIGFGHPGADLVLVDESDRAIVEPGVLGEIYLHSPALFTGYWNDPEATRAALVPDPLSPKSGKVVYRTGDLAVRGVDGELYFRGRADHQVKVLGNRVDLGEVERCVMGAPGVALAACLLLEPRGETGDPVLTAFVVPEADAAGPFDETALRAHCARAVPGYMVPQEIHSLDDMPVNTHGKIDRARLRELFAPRSTVVTGREGP
ncbi:AMP-binding protein [Streptomyces sp. Je 1-332]|uniref:AMP-binding protein n=1 Tax=Streptomyces sp. Je 1-332 TaxID=3231270 RepID=UPI00345A9E65